MKGYCHTDEFKLRYSDLDFKDELKCSAYLAFAQEVASNSAEELNFGYHALKGKGLGFIVVATACKFLRPAREGETLFVDTWPCPPRHVFFERQYRVRAGEEVIALLSSRWCLVDVNDFSLCTGERMGKAHEECPYNAEKCLQVTNWKIPKLGEEGCVIYELTVTSEHCDHYIHANNCRYADFFMGCFTIEELRRGVEGFRISYVKQAKEGDKLTFVRRDEGEISVCECRRGEELVAQFELTFCK